MAHGEEIRFSYERKIMDQHPDTPESKDSRLSSFLRFIRHKLLIPLVIGLLCYFINLPTRYSYFINFLENKTYDMRMTIRNLPRYAGIQAPTHKVDRDIVVIPIDNAALEKLETPMVFWVPYYADVFQHLVDGGAKVISLDYQFQVSTETFFREKSLDVISSILKEKNITMDEEDLLEYFPNDDLKLFQALRSDKVVLMSYLRSDGSLAAPYEPFANAAGYYNLALVNTEPDRDGVVRRQFLVKTDRKGDTYKSFAFLTAMKFLEGKDKIYFNDRDNKFYVGKTEIPVNANQEMLINYAAPAGAFSRGHSFWELVEKAGADDDQFFRDNFSGKAVLIGIEFSGTTDLANTPYNILKSPEMYGIEVHANTLNTILNRDFIHEVSPRVNGLILLIFTLVIAFNCYYTRPWVAFIVNFILMLLFVSIAFYLFVHYNTWIHMVSPLESLPLTFGLIYAYRFVWEDRQKRLVRKTLGRYVSEQVAREITRDPSGPALGGNRCEVTILFCDINGFTPYCEKSDPHEIIEILNDYFSRMEKVIFENDGTLKQFVGDEIMVICGAPRPNRDHAFQACRIALEMAEELKNWNETRNRENKDTFQVKFGLHSGEVVAGNVGSTRRSEYSTVGDVVNTASRIMGLCKEIGRENGTENETRILISAQTYSLVKDRVIVGEKQTFTVKGRKKPVEVYQLCGNVGT